jgi:hypothetical protein
MRNIGDVVVVVVVAVVGFLRLGKNYYHTARSVILRTVILGDVNPNDKNSRHLAPKCGKTSSRHYQLQR